VTDNPDREALDTARDLNETLGSLRDELAGVSERLRRQRRITWALAVIVTLVVLLGGVVTRVAFQAGDAARQAHHADVTVGQLHATQVDGCRAGNVTRHDEVALWDHLASLGKPQPGESAREIAAGRREVDGFLAYVAKVFAPRDCQALYRLP
jgi:hypothetical protein